MECRYFKNGRYHLLQVSVKHGGKHHRVDILSNSMANIHQSNLWWGWGGTRRDMGAYWSQEERLMGVNKVHWTRAWEVFQVLKPSSMICPGLTVVWLGLATGTPDWSARDDHRWCTTMVTNRKMPPTNEIATRTCGFKLTNKFNEQFLQNSRTPTAFITGCKVLWDGFKTENLDQYIIQNWT